MKAEQVSFLREWHSKRAKLSQYDEDAQLHSMTVEALGLLLRSSLIEPFSPETYDFSDLAPTKPAPAKPSARARKRAH